MSATSRRKTTPSGSKKSPASMRVPRRNLGSHENGTPKPVRRRDAAAERLEVHAPRKKSMLRVWLDLYITLDEREIPVKGKLLAAINEAIADCVRDSLRQKQTARSKTQTMRRTQSPEHTVRRKTG
jgi:hypothetical protein